MLKAQLCWSAIVLTAVVSVGQARAATPEPVICEESGGAINSSDESEDKGVAYGKMTIQFDQDEKPVSVMVERIATPQMASLNLNLNLKNAKLVKITIPHTDDVWGIESHQRVTAIGSDGSAVTINLGDHRYAGILSGSSVEIKKGRQSLSTLKIEHQVICMTPSAKAQYEKEISGAIE